MNKFHIDILKIRKSIPPFDKKRFWTKKRA